MSDIRFLCKFSCFLHECSFETHLLTFFEGFEAQTVLILSNKPKESDWIWTSERLEAAKRSDDDSESDFCLTSTLFFTLQSSSSGWNINKTAAAVWDFSSRTSVSFLWQLVRVSEVKHLDGSCTSVLSWSVSYFWSILLLLPSFSSLSVYCLDIYQMLELNWSLNDHVL